MNGTAKKLIPNGISVTSDVPYHLRDPLEILGETKFKAAQEVPEYVKGSDIQEFFRGRRVLITGGTGFLGKVVLEKLLRSVPHLEHIYLIIRVKKGKEINDRLNEIFEDRLFKRLKTEAPWFRAKVSALEGDCSLPGVGLSPEDRQTLIDKVDIVMHGAATVRFDEKLRLAVSINVLGTREMLKLAREIKHLKSYVHVSTAFANCNHLHIEERFYKMHTKYTEVLQLLKTKDDAELDLLTPSIIADWPNTYTFTKALAEGVVQAEGQGLPVAVFRPAVVIATYNEPVRGWIDNVYGPTGLLVGAGTGVLHTFMGDQNIYTDMVPVDLTANALIATVWKTGTIMQDKIPLYNYVSSVQNPITWKEFIRLNHKYGINWPTVRAVWYYSFVAIKSPLLFYIASFFLHTLPGYILDALAFTMGQTPTLTRIYKKLDKFADTMSYFSQNIWTFTNDSVQELWQSLSPEDQKEFFFDMSQMNWEYHAQAQLLGLRIYLIKDDVDTLPVARRKWRRLFWAHTAVKLAVLLFVLRLLYGIIAFGFTCLGLLFKF